MNFQSNLLAVISGELAALAQGQDWASIGIRCSEEGGGLRCVVEELEKGFFVDADGFVER